MGKIVDANGLTYFGTKFRELLKTWTWLNSTFAKKSEMSVTDGSGADADKVTIQLKTGTSTTVLKTHQDISGKVDKIPGMGLSTNDYTDIEKEQLAHIAEITPSTATSSNQLADEAFVNSSVQTATANFRGTYKTVSSVPNNASEYPQDGTGNRKPKVNDYMVVANAYVAEWNDSFGYDTDDVCVYEDKVYRCKNTLPEQGMTPTEYPSYWELWVDALERGEGASQLEGTWRFKYTGNWERDGVTGWKAEYQVNEKPLTMAQLAAINSGITEQKVTKLDGIETGAQVNKLEHIQINGTEQSISNKTINLPAYPTTLPASDVYPWAKASTKPSYTLDEVADGSTRKLSNYKTIDSLKSKGSTTKPVYFDSSGNAQPITSYEGNSATATNAKIELKTDQEFIFRKTNVTWGAKSGVVKKINGKTLVWNQLALRANPSAEVYGITRTANGNALHYSGTSTNSTNYTGTQAIDFQASHKYYYAGIGIPATCGISAMGGSSTVGVYADIYQASQDEQRTFGVYIPSGVSIDNDILFVCRDLTQMFGAGNEPSSVEEFEALYPLSYDIYNSGTLISNDAEAVETTGVNQFDKSTVTDGKSIGDDGSVSDIGARSISDYIPVFPSTNYYIGKSFDVSVGADHAWYDAGKNLISVFRVYNANNTIVESPANARYLRCTIYNSHLDDFIINLSNAAINGQYFPYWKRTLQLGITTRKDTDGNVPFADGMKGAGTAADWADKVGGEKRMKRLNLGDLNWTYNNSNPGGNFFYAESPVDSATIIQNSGIAFICSKYAKTNGVDMWTGATDKIVCMNVGYWTSFAQIAIRDSAYTAPAAFKDAMSGVMLDYELATPVPFTWAEPLPSVYPCDQYGTERVISPESITPSAPFVTDIQYGVTSSDIAFELNTIEDNYMSSGSMRNILDALVAAGLFASYTLTYNNATGKWDCTITPNS